MIDPRDSPTVSFSPLIRIDNRLVHGQILEAWIPFISASHIVVVNDDVADDPFRESIIKMAVPREIEIRIYNIEEFARNITCENYTEKGIVLFCSIGDLMLAYRFGFRFSSLNIGNVYNDDYVCQPTTSVSLSENNMQDLMLLSESGVMIEIRCVPRDKPVDFLDVVRQLDNSSHSQDI